MRRLIAAALFSLGLLIGSVFVGQLAILSEAPRIALATAPFGWSIVPPVTSSALYGVAMSDRDNGWAVGEGGIILRYDDAEWRQVTSPVTTTLRDVARLSATEAWAVGDNGVILHFAAGAWSVAERMDDVDLVAVAAAPDGTIMIAGNTQAGAKAEGLLLERHATRGWEAANWYERVDVPFRFADIDVIYQGNWTAVGFLGSTNGFGSVTVAEHCELPDPDVVVGVVHCRGLTEIEHVGGSGPRLAVAMGGDWDDQETWIATRGGAVDWRRVVRQGRTSVGGGSDIFDPQPGFSTALHDIRTPAPGEIWAVGASGKIVHYANKAWQPVDQPGSRATLHALDMLSPDEGWAVGDKGTILHYAAAAQPRPIFLPMTHRSVLPAR
jgi:photosystem II stability/assembly factor-like uncharacterized protein